jgi:hypothetical protein
MQDRILVALFLTLFGALRLAAWRMGGTAFTDRLAQDTRSLSWIMFALAAGVTWGAWL